MTVRDAEEDVLQIFFKERELNGDLISRASDILWQRKFRSTVDSDDISKLTNNTTSQQPGQVQQNPCVEFFNNTFRSWLPFIVSSVSS